MRLPQRLETLLPEFGRIPQPGRKRERDAPGPGGSSKANAARAAKLSRRDQSRSRTRGRSQGGRGWRHADYFACRQRSGIRPRVPYRRGRRITPARAFQGGGKYRRGAEIVLRRDDPRYAFPRDYMVPLPEEVRQSSLLPTQSLLARNPRSPSRRPKL